MEFSTAAVAAIIGATVREVDYWAREGVLKPSARDAAGKGSRRRWTFTDLVALQAVRELRNGGCPLATIRKIIRHLRSHYPDRTPAESLGRLKLITDGKRVFFVDDDHQAMDLLSRQTVFSLPIGNLILQTSRLVEAMPQRWQEKTLMGGRAFSLEVSRAAPTDEYIAQCRELPGAIARSATADIAVAELKQKITVFLEFSKNQRNTPRRAVAHGSTRD
jgi:DNA-binding transcriptional MerR regulator